MIGNHDSAVDLRRWFLRKPEKTTNSLWFLFLHHDNPSLPLLRDGIVVVVSTMSIQVSMAAIIALEKGIERENSSFQVTF